MDFSVIFQLRTKKFWWMDVIFYFVISSLVATVLCYVIFLTKNSFLRSDIRKETVALRSVGTDDQKLQEKEVIDYQGKISNFSGLLKNHEFASNVFAFMQAQTLPNIWFKQFTLDENNNAVQLAGESDDMDSFSRQVVSFEKNQYVKNIGTLSSSLGQSAKVSFDINLDLDQSIFSYIYQSLSVFSTTTSSGQSPVQPGQAVSGNQTAQSGNPSLPAGAQTPSAGSQQPKSSEKLITSFDILSNPEVVGVIDETNYAIVLNVPYGTNVKKIIPSIVSSPGANVVPASNASQDFTNPVSYKVMAQDGSIQNYIAKVIMAAPPKPVKKSQPWLIVLIVIFLVVIVAAAAAAFILFWKKQQVKKVKI